MASFKSHPFFYTSLLLAGALTAGQAWMLFSQRSDVHKISAEIEQKKEALDAFQRQNPFPSRENLEAIEEDRLAAEKTRGQIRSLLQAEGDVSASIASAVLPVSPTEAFFDIANYVERLRALARETQVGFAPENRFGFSAYSTRGPEGGLVKSVFEQRQYAEYLIGALLRTENPPKEFIGLQRGQPVNPGSANIETSGGGGSGDYFSMDARTSARVSGSVATIPFRLSFIGNTAVLRDFLNELALFKVPVVVRSVEVESLGGNSRASSPAPRAANNIFGGNSPAANTAEAVKPLVEQVDSRFIVTVEIVSLVTNPVTAEATAEAAPENTY